MSSSLGETEKPYIADYFAEYDSGIYATYRFMRDECAYISDQVYRHFFSKE